MPVRPRTTPNPTCFWTGCPLFPHSRRRARLSLAIRDAMIYIVQGCDFQPSMLANGPRWERLHRSWRRISRVVLHIILPLGVGSLIYILWRTPTLRVFRWFDTLGLGSEIFRLRQSFAPYRAVVPRWVLFSLPAALWMYAMAAWFQMALSRSDRRTRWIWLSIALSLGVGSELGQLWRVVPGTFDGRDVAFYLAGWIAAIVCTPKREIHNETQPHLPIGACSDAPIGWRER